MAARKGCEYNFTIFLDIPFRGQNPNKRKVPIPSVTTNLKTEQFIVLYGWVMTGKFGTPLIVRMTGKIARDSLC